MKCTLENVLKIQDFNAILKDITYFLCINTFCNFS